MFGFLGPNGAGKTTAVKLLLGLAWPTAGDGLVLGQPIGDRATRGRIGYLPELFRYQAWLTAHEVLALHAQLAGLPAPARRARDRPGPGADRPGRAGRRPDRRVLEGHAAAARAGRGAARRSRAGDPRRADLGARPGRPRGRAGDHRRGARPRLDRVPQLASAGRGRATVRPGRDRQPRPCGRGRRRWATCSARRRFGSASPDLPAGDAALAPLSGLGTVERDDDWLTIRHARSRSRSRTRWRAWSRWAGASMRSSPGGARSRSCSWAWSRRSR